MSTYNQGNPSVSQVISASNVYLIGNTSSGNALSVQQLGAGNVASFRTQTGATALFVNAAGNVGVGITNPIAQLHVNGGGQATATAFSTTGLLGGSIILQDSGASAYNGGAVVFGASQGYFAAIKGAIQDGTTNTKGDLYFATRNAIADTTLATRMTITSGGNVGIGTTNPSSYTLQVSGTIGATGDITAYFSDERLKTKTGLIESALEKVLSLEAFTYVPNDLAKSFGFEDSKQRVGLSAQSVQRILPEAVCPAPFDADNKSGQQYLTVQYEKLVPLLVEAIKELAVTTLV